MEKFITARFKGKCAETASKITKGDNILYDTQTGKVYSSRSGRYKKAIESRSTAVCVQAQEEAYYDDFCRKNNI